MILTRLDALERDTTLRDPDAFVDRCAALDALEFPILDALTPDTAPHRRALALHAALSAINTRLFAQLRTRLTAPETAFAERRAVLRRYAPHDTADALSYDALDTLVDGVLALAAEDGPPTPLGPELVAFQPTPARLILELVERGPITPADRLVDLGAGLGHVALLVALLTGAATVGIELDPQLVAAAQQSAARLGLTDVTFVNADVRAADLTGGTVFYLYTPFTGTVLRQVLEQLRGIAAHHPITVCAYGPYLAALAEQPWLREQRGTAANQQTAGHAAADAAGGLRFFASA